MEGEPDAKRADFTSTDAAMSQVLEEVLQTTHGDRTDGASASSNPNAGTGDVTTIGSVKVRQDRPKPGKSQMTLNTQNLMRYGANPIDGCEIIGGDPDNDNEGHDDDCATTYSTLGVDIPLEPGQQVVHHSCARINRLVNLDIPGRALKKLILISNDISRIEGLETNENLEHLELYQNQIKKIEGLEPLKKLIILDLSFNNIRKFGCLGKDMPFTNSLKKLYLPNNKLEEIPEGTIGEFVNLEVLELGANRLREIDDLGLGKLTKLKELWLGKNKITSMYIPPLPNLEKISIQCNRLDKWDLEFFKNVPKLKELYLSENLLPNFPPFQDSFAHIPELTDLDLAHNAITKIDGDFRLENLRELWINSNKIDFDTPDDASIAGLWKLKLSCIYMEHNPCWDANYKNGGEKYIRILRQVCGTQLQQLDSMFLQYEDSLEKDYYGTVYATRDNAVKGIRKMELGPGEQGNPESPRDIQKPSQNPNEDADMS